MSTVSELLEHASKLDHLDQVELVAPLLENLDLKPHYVSDEEAKKG